MSSIYQHHLSSRQISENIFQGLIQPILMIGALTWGLIGIADYNILEIVAGNGMVVKGIYMAIGVAGIIELVAFWQTVAKRLT